MTNITTSTGEKTVTLVHIVQYCNGQVIESANYVLRVFAPCISSIEVVFIQIDYLTTAFALCQA